MDGYHVDLAESAGSLGTTVILPGLLTKLWRNEKKVASDRTPLGGDGCSTNWLMSWRTSISFNAGWCDGLTGDSLLACSAVADWNVIRDVVSTGPATTDNTTFRFVTDNAGPWFLHCHIDRLEPERETLVPSDGRFSGLATIFAEDVPALKKKKVPAATESVPILRHQLNSRSLLTLETPTWYRKKPDFL
ncbi:hypothetical protein B0H17DRAFT_1131916 [Mycena rosella]|uniref:Plastocyanin-like domain-containing protein n=1 Tax=Mycena rosella TaxID=1033263 RepID=A0AAD7DM82_MYCRO|nr:hypothetical protein B0H17DRAFT_1131916 [Mycena rosella]